MCRTPAPSGFARSWWRGRLLPRLRTLALLFLAVATPPLAGQGGPLHPPSNGGIARFDRLLQRLAEPRRLLVIAAHPDDEDTGLLTLAARGYGADAAYLALSRGEGGQNLIGPELGVALGLVRTQELLAARAIDGARQFFTRAFDFGYTRELAETERFWQPDTVLKDVVRVMRRFRPHVVVAVFSGTPRDGHGQHQMSGVIARRAFAVAGDAATFPELEAEEGLSPWEPLKLYASRRFNLDGSTMTLPVAGVDPGTGQTLGQIAMASRSQHRSQGFGVLQRIGPTEARLALEQTRVSTVAEDGLFGGIPAGVSWLTQLADSLRSAVGPATLDQAVPVLAAALSRVRAEGGSAADERVLSEALAIAAGVLVDARAERARLVPGETNVLELEVFNGGTRALDWPGATIIPSATGWTAQDILTPAQVHLAPGVAESARKLVRVPNGARPTRPYFTGRPLLGGLYDWTGVAPAVRGLPDGPPALIARYRLTIAGTRVVLEREVTFREQDQAVGERRYPLAVVPRVEVTLDPDTVLWSIHDTVPMEFTVTLHHHAADTTRGEVRLAIDGWPAVAPQPFVLTHRDETATVTVPVRRPPEAGAGDASVHASAVTEMGDYTDGATPIRYPHIRPTVWERRAESRVRIADARRPGARRIGYVRGASDRVPEALDRAGLPVHLIDAATLARGDFSAYDVIVIGSRAYETDAALVAHNDLLLAWVRTGGHLLVQYQQYEFARGGFAPYPIEIRRPHDRITDETSPVTILEPSHPAFRVPNRIAPADWNEWPQERGLYFAGTWDAAYTSLLEMQDPGQQPVRGGLLVAPVGRGTYVYTGLSFFRALPAGVPGAFRLFFNLLDLNSGTQP